MSRDSQKIFFFILLLSSSLAGIYVGYFTIHKFDILVKGISGAAILVLINLVLFRQKGVPFNRPIELHRDIVYIPLVFVSSILSYWSIRNLVEMLIYYF